MKLKRLTKLTRFTFNPEAFTFVDLGLSSGRLWATENAPDFYTFEEAVKTFGELLPKGSAMVELIEECKCTWNDEKKGLDITGPNGNSIFLPADGCRWEMKDNNVKLEGNYWTRMSKKPYSQVFARFLYFNAGRLDPLDTNLRSYGFSVRLCRESH